MAAKAAAQCGCCVSMLSGQAGQRLAMIRLLADQQGHSAQSLAAQAGMDAAHVQDAVAELAAMGLDVALIRGEYFLQKAIELLDAQRITAALTVPSPLHLHVLSEVGSTNTVLRGLAPPPGQAVVCLAEYQHEGRGRLGRNWLAAFGTGLCLSLGWCFERQPSELSGLSLAAGVAVHETLAAHGVAGLALKWPNDLLLQGGKLGGILVEVLGATNGCTHVITGIGINVSLSDAAREAVRKSGGKAAALADVAAGANRNALAADLINAVAEAMRRYEADGLDAFRDAWNKADALSDQPVRVFAGADTIDGVARGIDHSGALAVDVAGQRRHFAGGEVSLRRMCDVAD